LLGVDGQGPNETYSDLPFFQGVNQFHTRILDGPPQNIRRKNLTLCIFALYCCSHEQ
jgi:hypothetical protein